MRSLLIAIVPISYLLSSEAGAQSFGGHWVNQAREDTLYSGDVSAHVRVCVAYIDDNTGNKYVRVQGAGSPSYAQQGECVDARSTRILVRNVECSTSTCTLDNAVTSVGTYTVIND